MRRAFVTTPARAAGSEWPHSKEAVMKSLLAMFFGAFAGAAQQGEWPWQTG
ncbi:MAG: hypothetical protein JOZ72_08305 [Alphaproteobacteria bacterium]|nr:hypothetical protein [Alphaproteobacteria bacterium]